MLRIPGRAVLTFGAGLALASCGVGSGPSSDSSSPQVRIDSPTAGSVVGGLVSIKVTAIDDFGVENVRILVDGQELAKLIIGPYEAIWNARSITDNLPHLIRVEAVDAALNVGIQQISVTVLNGTTAPPADPR